MKINLAKQKYLYITLIFAILPRIILCFFINTLVYYPSDEVATVSGAALLAGYNWSQVVSTAGYYGQGFYSLFAPLYKLTDNPFVIFKISIIVCSIIQGMTALMSYHCLTRYLKLKNPSLICAISVAASYLLDTRSTNLLNETPLMLMCWIILAILFHLNEAAMLSKSTRKYTIYLILALAYSITLHTRAVILCVALLITVLFYYWTYRKWLVSPSIMIGLGTLGAVLGSIGIALMQSRLWGASGGTIRNASININLDMLLNLLKPYSWQAAANIVLGLINTSVLLSFGFMMIAIVVFIKLIGDCLARKHSVTADFDCHASYYVTGSIFFMTCTAIMIIGLAIKWLPGASQGIQDGLGSNNYGFRSFVYYRYFAVFLSPLLMLVLSYMHQYNIKHYFKAATITLILSQTYWMVCIVPYLYTFHDFEVKKFFTLSLFCFNKVNIWIFMIASMVLFVSWFVFWYLYSKNKYLLSICILSLLLIINYAVFVIQNDYQKQDTNYNLVNAGYDFVKTYEDTVNFPSTIYVPEDNKLPYLYQYFLIRYTIIPSYPSVDCEQAIVLWHTQEDPTLLSMGYVWLQLDKNEYLYVKGNELISALDAKGFHFQE
ncbi:hypothetical protein [Lachnotalea glycerini]|uniref:Glycosyltransferase RgtA/B/C/D-like domain-containing protein n=1 Tax=Lachnotalea glycerini TaxID=1763509 RepID=A0A371JD16_9FIRM|nr:hypothetical protein [Lachnotalea glycerini]RDY30557.1 hypothetical protein CG710_014220 [Lachnotalea glycerini]